MKLYGALILLVTLSAACGLRCYSCSPGQPDCTKIDSCPAGTDRCAYADVYNEVTKSCMISEQCKPPINCCEGDLCNGAAPSGPRILLLLASSALFTFFI